VGLITPGAAALADHVQRHVIRPAEAKNLDLAVLHHVEDLFGAHAEILGRFRDRIVSNRDSHVSFLLPVE